MKHYITIAICTFLSQMCTGQVMMLFTGDSLSNISSPLDLDSLFYWFAADVGVTDSLGGAIATDEGVGTWNDLSGNGHHVTQSTDGARPVYKATGGPGSKPTIQFDGTNDFLASAAHWWGSDDITVFVVMKFANATRDATDGVVGRYSTTNNRQWWFSSFGSPRYDGVLRVHNTPLLTPDNKIAGTSSSNFKHTAYKIHSWINNGASSIALFSDGSSISLTQVVSGSGDYTINDDTQPLDIGAVFSASTPTAFLLGSISEIIVFSRALTATERAAIELYLNRKYDLY